MMTVLSAERTVSWSPNLRGCGLSFNGDAIIEFEAPLSGTLRIQRHGDADWLLLGLCKSVSRFIMSEDNRSRPDMNRIVAKRSGGRVISSFDSGLNDS